MISLFKMRRFSSTPRFTRPSSTPAFLRSHLLFFYRRSPMPYYHLRICHGFISSFILSLLHLYQRSLPHPCSCEHRLMTPPPLCSPTILLYLLMHVPSLYSRSLFLPIYPRSVPCYFQSSVILACSSILRLTLPSPSLRFSFHTMGLDSLL